MSKLQSSSGIVCWLAIVVLSFGCGQESSPTTASIASSPSPSKVVSPANEAALETEVPVTISNPTLLEGLSEEDANAIVSEPIVSLSTEHAASCKVRVGDLFPALDLKTMDGQLGSLEKEYGDRLTVAIFWNLQHPMSIEQVARINKELLTPFQNAGVNVVAINVGDTVDDVKSFMQNVNCGAAQFLDEGASGFQQIAEHILPRTYLIDATGTVCWLDLEYSRSTRRELRNAVIYNLKMQVATTPDLM
ncbi:MAG: redoxin domain-containing protein [Planctomycetaceae bacterium]|nr:redoxin domain-containing protein [Planctomycetaceae bacterium]